MQNLSGSKKITFNDDILSFKYKDNYIHIRNKENTSSKLTIHERLADAAAYVEVNGQIKETKLLVEPLVIYLSLLELQIIHYCSKFKHSRE